MVLEHAVASYDMHNSVVKDKLPFLAYTKLRVSNKCGVRVLDQM